MRASSHDLDRVEVRFDDDHAVADAGLVLLATLAAHLGLEAATDALGRGRLSACRKTATLVHALLAGADGSRPNAVQVADQKVAPTLADLESQDDVRRQARPRRLSV